ncbi:hypothetical protein BOH78_3443 [Pichia kudriavzevii]|uniref:Uncharacterized protein n=1 Tax=Pichia kudriavzevii TaxID=4909 RepID=A0A099NRT5_PICKU|nr:hypothetical protein JL09_g6092 [Pichia kudriavzevii]ONH72934.1 hypothetical protein BOH78_3443 [Pichia kudriavzevii]
MKLAPEDGWTGSVLGFVVDHTAMSMCLCAHSTDCRNTRRFQVWSCSGSKPACIGG